MFEDSQRGDTPMGLLRGIKFGTESYHVLFKRLCRCENAFGFNVIQIIVADP
jgi:hypothetical protein